MPDTMISETERPSLKNLAGALCKAQAEMEGAKKDALNPHFRNKYADLASVWEAIRGPLTKNGLSVVQLLRSVQGGVEVETILLHSSGERISDVFAMPASKADAQGYGSAATYARRYALMALVGVAPEDDDGNAASKPHVIGGNVPPVDPGDAHLIRKDAINPDTGEVASQYKLNAAEEARRWADNLIGTIKLSGQTRDSLSALWKTNARKLKGLEERHSAQYERVLSAYDAAMDAAAA